MKITHNVLDCPGLSVGIILGLDSSSIKANQRRGRVIRKESDKTAEIFNLILVDTVEQKWFSEAHKNDSIIKIDEENLYKVLQGKPYEQYRKKLTNLSFRF
jgi:superfamily II DNA or RNA helicase